MSSRAAVSTLVVGMFLTGCANSLLTKWQDKQCVEYCDSPEPLYFEQPVWQTLNMFIGEFGCVIPLLYGRYVARGTAAGRRKGGYAAVPSSDHAGTGEQDALMREDEDEGGDEQQLELGLGERLTGWRMCWMWFPAFFDICGTTLMNVGLILTPVSIYQMSRGALVLWVGVLSVIFLKRRLWLYQWSALLLVTLGVVLVGLSGSLVSAKLEDEPSLIDTALRVATTRNKEDDPARVALGVALILFAQVFTATQYVVEEKIMSHYHTPPLQAVSLEGFFGLVTTLLAMPFLHFFFSARSPYFDMPRGWAQLAGHSTVLWLSFAICFSIGAFNYFGLSVTSRVSATTRSTIDTCRTLGIWVVSLGVGWERLVWPQSGMQVIGFGLLVYGTFIFNGLVRPPFCAPPHDVAISLPHEPELEETGAVPAAAAQGRAGYDVVPGRASGEA